MTSNLHPYAQVAKQVATAIAFMNLSFFYFGEQSLARSCSISPLANGYMALCLQYRCEGALYREGIPGRISPTPRLL